MLRRPQHDAWYINIYFDTFIRKRDFLCGMMSMPQKMNTRNAGSLTDSFNTHMDFPQRIFKLRINSNVTQIILRCGIQHHWTLNTTIWKEIKLCLWKI